MFHALDIVRVCSFLEDEGGGVWGLKKVGEEKEKTCQSILQKCPGKKIRAKL
jgi:hypothetical protein